MDFGSIFTSSASGSCSLLAIDVALLCPTSNFGNSSDASLLAEYTDAPASFTITYCTFCGISFNSSTMNCSDSLDAVPFPTEINVMLYFAIIFFSRSLDAWIFSSVSSALSVDHCRSDHFTGRIYNCKFTSGTECWIPSKYSLSYDWRLHQKLMQILLEYADCPVFCLLCQVASDLTLNSQVRSDAYSCLLLLLFKIGVVCGLSLWIIFFSNILRCHPAVLQSLL